MITMDEERDPEGASRTAEPGTNGDAHYTGVVVVHGLGDEPRNSILMEVVNALAFWFDQKAGFALRPTGPNHVWVTTELTEKEDPDAPASRATIELQAPTAPGERSHPSTPFQLKFREVWWAQSFGIQPLGTTIRWARVQAREQVRHILIPVGRQLRRGRSEEHESSGNVATSAPLANEEPGMRLFRPLLRIGLAIYAGIQAAWKIVQWLVLTPIVLGLLILISALQIVSFIGFIQSAVVSSFNALTKYVMLHWIASTQVYMRDYSLAAEIRERFEREVEAFLRDERCDRVVVLAYSMGTVIAYEGLTTIFSRSKAQPDKKPITFVCLAGALRRVWLLPGIDASRLHGVLPDHVRWIHFWARYDPVAVGPLTAEAFPRLTEWSDAVLPNPSEAIRASLDRCKNVVVANTDSSFTDHTTYWSNVEQVVGPIARELVSDHEDLDQVVRARLTTRDGVLRRRWSIAWRYMLALAAGTLAGGGFLVWQILNPGLSIAVLSFLSHINIGDFIGSVCPACKLVTPPSLPMAPSGLSSKELSHYFALWYFLTLHGTAVLVVAAALALIIGVVAMQGVGSLVARRSPFDAVEAVATEAAGTSWVFVLSAVTLALAFVTSLLFTTFVGTRVTLGQESGNPAVTIFLVMLAAAELANCIAFGAAVIDAISNRRWNWVAVLVLTILLCYTFDPFYRSALLGVAVVGCLVALFGLAVKRRTGMYWVVGLQLAAILYLGIGALAADIRLVPQGSPGTGAYIESIMPSFLYGLWLVTSRRGVSARRILAGSRIILVLTTIYLVLFYLLSLSEFGSVLVVLPDLAKRHLSQKALTNFTHEPLGALTLPDDRVWAIVLVAVVAFVLGLVDAARTRRWIWLLAMPLVLAGMTAVFIGLRVGAGVEPAVPDDVLAFSLAPLATALIYALWAGAGAAWPAQRKPRVARAVPGSSA